jgi:membrane protein required for colicin V production
VNVPDIILASLLLFGIIRGFLRGFIYEIAILGIIFICYFFGFRLAEYVAEFLGNLFNVKGRSLYYISLIVTWIGVSIGIFFIAKLLEGLINIIALGIFNKIAGALFGGFKYAVVISVVLFFLNKINVTAEWFNADAKAESVLYYPILKISAVFF